MFRFFDTLNYLSSPYEITAVVEITTDVKDENISVQQIDSMLPRVCFVIESGKKKMWHTSC